MDGMKPDLTALYSELRLRPDCSLAELQLAYRRRISELQSNRMAGSTPSPESLATLRDLISLYTTASRFHRRYGRLPGAPPQRGRAFESTRFPVARAPQAWGEPSSDEQPTRSPWGMGVALGLLVLLFLLLALASGEWMR
jgi:hypothetical protein